MAANIAPSVVVSGENARVHGKRERAGCRQVRVTLMAWRRAIMAAAISIIGKNSIASMRQQ